MWGRRRFGADAPLGREQNCQRIRRERFPVGDGVMEDPLSLPSNEINPSMRIVSGLESR